MDSNFETTSGSAPSSSTPSSDWLATKTAPATQKGGLPRKSRRTTLTNAKLNALASKKLTRPVDISDDNVRGLVARVRPNGSRAFYFRWRVKGTSRWRKVRLDASNVEEARLKAMEAAADKSFGRDPRVSRAALTKVRPLTVREAADEYCAYLLTTKGRKAGYVANVRSMFRNYVEPTLGDARLIDLTQHDLANLFAGIMATVSAKASGDLAVTAGSAPVARKRKRGRPVDSRKRIVTTLPNRVHTQVGGLLRWAERNGKIPPGVAPSVERPIAEEPSKRRLREGTKLLLGMPHLARVWLAVEDDEIHVRNLVRLLLLIPLRREEVTGLSWHEVKSLMNDESIVKLDHPAFDAPALDLPATRMKGKRPHMAPLPPLALSLVREMHEHRGTAGPFVFSPSAGKRKFAGWQTLMARLRRRCSDMPEGWTIHDIRTGCATAMGDMLDVDDSIIARLLSHSLETQLGVTFHYNLSRRVRPMLDALTRWEGLLLEAVEAERRRRAAEQHAVDANVVRLPARAV
jgi:integrase